MFGLKVFKYLLKIPAIIFIVGFVVLNQQNTTLYISPLASPLELPLWIMGLVLFGVGFVVGALLLWLNNWPIRKQLREAKSNLKATEKDLEALKDTMHTRSHDNSEEIE